MSNEGTGGTVNPAEQQGDVQAVEKLQSAYKALKAQMHQVIVGQDVVLDQLLAAIFARGHALVIGVPGLAKTLMIRTLSQCLSLSFSRIQFTPDLMPSDITGTEVIYEDKASGKRDLTFLKGPIFAHIILADEINRTPPKTQAALLEAMQELQVTAGGKKYILDEPFFVLATQNPIEQEGTYPLPEAQLDRFLLSIPMEYPSVEEEMQIVRVGPSVWQTKLTPVLTKTDILQLQSLVQRIPVSDHVLKYILAITRATRKAQTTEQHQFIREWVQWGVGPRASQYLALAAKSHAILNGRTYVSTQDVKEIAVPALRHRMVLNFSATAEGITSDKIIEKLLDVVPDKETELDRILGSGKVLEGTK